MIWDEWRGGLDGRPVMWMKFFVKRPWLQIALHKFVAADDHECFHTHPATAIRIILRGGYVEEILDGSLVEWRPWSVGIVRPGLCHRIALVTLPASYSLWIRFRKTAEVTLYGAGWENQRT